MTARVLVVGAHPDDEDTRLIAYLARGRHAETAYLSLTRGDGGQNLIGNELGEALGAIRTEELLAARRIDGGRQYFTRAFDFGFSKTAEETFQHWPHDTVLGDVVRVVRAFRPQVMIAIFSGTPADGHGHHQASGILAREAYDAAGDTVRFPRAAFGSRRGPSGKFYRNTSYRGSESATLRYDAGAYDPVLGRSYAELAAISRSQHKSQGQGGLERKGPSIVSMRREASRVNGDTPAYQERDLFTGVDTSWAQVARGVRDARARAAVDSLQTATADARAAHDARHTSTLIAPLARVRALLMAACPPAAECECERDHPRGGPGATHAQELRPCLGDRPRVTRCRNRDEPRDRRRGQGRSRMREVTSRGDSRSVTAPPSTIADATRCSVSGVIVATTTRVMRRRAYRPRGTSHRARRCGIRVETRLDSVSAHRSGSPRGVRATCSPHRSGLFDRAHVPTVAYSHGACGDRRARGRRAAPVTYRVSPHPVRGQIDRPVAGAPAISVTLDRAVQYARANVPTGSRGHRSPADRVDGRTHGHGPPRRFLAGLTADSATRTVALPGYDARAAVEFRVRGTLRPGRTVVRAQVESNGEHSRPATN